MAHQTRGNLQLPAPPRQTPANGDPCHNRSLGARLQDRADRADEQTNGPDPLSRPLHTHPVTLNPPRQQGGPRRASRSNLHHLRWWHVGGEAGGAGDGIPLLLPGSMSSSRSRHESARPRLHSAVTKAVTRVSHSPKHRHQPSETRCRCATQAKMLTDMSMNAPASYPQRRPVHFRFLSSFIWSEPRTPGSQEAAPHDIAGWSSERIGHMRFHASRSKGSVQRGRRRAK